MLIENSVFHPWLGIQGCQGPSVCIVLYILYRELEHSQIWVSAGVLEPISPSVNTKGRLNFEGSQKLYVDCSNVNCITVPNL